MSTTGLQMLSEIVEVCLIPLLGVLVSYLVKFINVKSNELKARVDNDMAKKYISMLSETITNCVIATNQTYVDTLKKQGKFDADAQKIAFKMTLNSVLAILNDDAKKYLTEVYGDLDAYITKQIEATVNHNKIEVVQVPVSVPAEKSE